MTDFRHGRRDGHQIGLGATVEKLLRLFDFAIIECWFVLESGKAPQQQCKERGQAPFPTMRLSRFCFTFPLNGFQVQMRHSI